jgi:hypothetical protein|eukprot:COSAG02_NODE_219_length_28538_cov_79.322058_9_plen_57_part_00
MTVYVTPPLEPSDEPAVPWDHSAFVEDSYLLELRRMIVLIAPVTTPHDDQAIALAF